MPSAVVALSFGDGTRIEAWDSFEVHDDFQKSAEGRYGFTAAPPRHRVAFYRTNLKKGELVALSVNGVPQTVALIETVTTTVSRSGGVRFDVDARNPLITATHGNVDPDLAISTKADVPVSNVILQALAPYGFSELEGDASANTAAVSGRQPGGGKADVTVSALTASDAHASDNETAYGFCSRIITRLGAVLRLRHDGTLLVTRPNYEQAPMYTLVQGAVGSTPPGDRFFGEVVITDSNESQFSECVVRGAAPAVRGATTAGLPIGRVAPVTNAVELPDYEAAVKALDGAPFAKVKATAMVTSRQLYRSTAARYRPLIIQDKNARDIKRCESVAKLALGLRASKAFVVEGEVDGLVSVSGAVWSIDTVARVYIEAADLDLPMWIAARTFLQDRTGGQRTKLKLIPLHSLVFGDLP